MPSNLIVAAATAFRRMVDTIRGTQDPSTQLQQTIASLGEIANAMDLFATSTAAHEQQILSAQTTADEAKAEAKSMKNNQPTPSPMRKPLCESRSVANLKILGFKKEEFKNWNDVVPQYVYDSNTPFFNIIVPTADT